MILFRYVARDVFAAMIAVAAVVLTVAMASRFSGYLDHAAEGLLTSDVLFILMLYRLPGFLELILPISFFLGVMLVYGRMYVDSEMVVLQACGLSPAKLTGITLILATVVMVLTAMMSLWLKPAGEQALEALLVSQKRLTEFDTLAPGRFQTLRSGRRVTYTEELTDEGLLEDLFIADRQRSEFLEPDLTVNIAAEYGESIVRPDGRRFLVLRNGTRYQGEPGNEGWRVVSYEEYGQLIPVETDMDYERRSAISTGDLLPPTTPQQLSELQWRFSVVLLVPVIAVMAIPLSRANPRQGRFLRVMPGVLLSFLYIILLSAAQSAIEKEQLPGMPGLFLVHAAFIALAFFLLRRERW